VLGILFGSQIELRSLLPNRLPMWGMRLTLITCTLEDIGSLLGLAQQLKIRILKRRRGMIYLFVAAAGLIAGLLLAPKPGEETRGMVKERFNSLRDKVMKKESTNGTGLEEEGLESTGRADYLH
jgi:hypothetical protein